MELTHLKYFVRLAETLNFTEAARQLFITQSTLSQSIRQTEASLGIPLFERIGKKVYLTEAGREFLPYAVRAIEEVNEGMQRLGDMQKIYRGELRIGVVYSLCPLLAGCASLFSQAYPDVTLHLFHSSSINELTERVHDHRIDFALSYQPSPLSPLIDTRELFSLPLCLIVRSDSPLALLPEVSLQMMDGWPLVLLESGMYLRQIIAKLAGDHHVALQPKAEVNSSNLLLQMVHTGRWCSISLQNAVAQFPDLVAVPIREAHSSLTVSLLWLKNSYQKTAAREFMGIIEKAAAGQALRRRNGVCTVCRLF